MLCRLAYLFHMSASGRAPAAASNFHIPNM